LKTLRLESGDDAKARRFAAGALIRRCLANAESPIVAELIDLLRQSGEDAVLRVANYHRVEGWLYECLRGVPAASGSLLATLKAQRNWAAQRHLHGAWQLHRVAELLDGCNVRWAIVKGPVLAELLHGSGGRRTYHDLDVLVHPADFARAIDAMEAAGGRLLDRNWELLRRERRGQVHLELQGGIELDLHWNLVNVHRRHLNIDTAAVLARRAVIEIASRPVHTLDAVDSVIHLAVHAALSGGDRLVWIKDIERAVAVRPPDWDELIARSREWRVAGPVGVMLHRARALLDAPVPRSVPANLIGRRRHRLVERIDRRWPVEASRGGPAPGRVMARIIGHGLFGGAAVLFSRGVRHFDPREPWRSSPFTPAGDVRDRDAYLAAVTAAEER
jgi:hypothetical protein